MQEKQLLVVIKQDSKKDIVAFIFDGEMLTRIQMLGELIAGPGNWVIVEKFL